MRKPICTDFAGQDAISGSRSLLYEQEGTLGQNAPAT